MSERQGVEIDYCPECRGVWLDRGELDKIISRAAEQHDSRPHPAAAAPQQPDFQPQAQYYQQGYGYQHGHGHNKPYRKKSLLEELFD
jgi:Zn-finger nucleic acid-binding protein